MPKRTPYLLQWSTSRQTYELFGEDLSHASGIIPGSRAWTEWLEEISSFAFSGRSGVHYTVRKEHLQQRRTYWYAYRFWQGRTIKRYIGRTADLSPTRLEEVVERFPPESLPHPLESAPLASTLDFSPLLLSRLRPPRLPLALIERVDLLRRLDDWRSYKLALLQAPAGSGKTTLVNSWVRRQPPSRVVWISLEASDNTPFQFWHTLILACQQWRKDLGKTALAHLHSALQPPFIGISLKTVLTLFLNDLAEQVSEGILVLDDYDVIGESHLSESLSFFLEHLPAQLHVMILSRGKPSLSFPLTRWRAQGWVQEFLPADLRFSAQETAAFLQQATASVFAESTIARLDSLLQGWVVGLRLLVLAGQMTRTGVESRLSLLEKQSESDALHTQLLDYFISEVLGNQPEPLQRFLLLTSGLPRLTASLCDAVTDRRNSATLLEAAERAGLFLEARDEAEPWYRYPALFAQAMRDEARRRLGMETLDAIARQASLWYEQQMLAIEAIEMALQAHDKERAGILIERFGARGQRYNLQMLQKWLEQIGDVVLYAHPALCLYAATALQFQASQPGASPTLSLRIEALLQRAEEIWRASRQSVWIGLIYAFRAFRAAWQMQSLQKAVEYATEALALLPEKSIDGQAEYGLAVLEWRTICLGIAGMANIRQGHFVEARRILLEALLSGSASNQPPFLRQINLRLGEVCMLLGELRQAYEYNQQALSSGRAQSDYEETMQALSGLVCISIEWNDLAAAEQWTNEALELAKQRNQEESVGAAYLVALLHFARRQYAAASLRLATLLAHLQAAPTGSVLERLPDVVILQTRLQLAMGDSLAAQSSLAMLAEPDLELSFSQQMSMHILQVRLQLLQGQTRDTLARLEQLLLTAREKQQMSGQLEIQILLALTCATLKRKNEARDWLQQAIVQAAPRGFLRIFLSFGEPLASLLRSVLPALREKVQRSYGQSILRAFLHSEDPGSLSPALLEKQPLAPLSPQEQRVLRLLVAGRTNLEIASELIISVNTVKDHIKHLYHKLGVSNRLEASEAARHLRHP